MTAAATWYVLGPAGQVTPVNQDGIPAEAMPRLTVSEIRDLPMACQRIAEGGEPDGQRRIPHRNHVYLARHDGLYFAMFSYWYGPEDQPGGIVRYATSTDGITWSEARPLAQPATGHGIIARGFVERDGRLFAWYATHTGDTFFRGGQPTSAAAQEASERNIAILESEWMGEADGWRFNRTVIEGYLNNYAPRGFDGTLTMALRDQDRQTFLATSRDDGLTWDVGPAMPVPLVPERGEPGLFLPDEPVVVSRTGNAAHVLLRNNNTFDRRLWAAEVVDGAWQAPYPLEFPAAASKFVPLDLADGSSAMIGNFEPEVHRALLHLALSGDGGESYDRLYRLALEGQYSDFGWRSPQYPHALVDGDRMLLAFSYGKRDIALCSASAEPDELERQAGFALVPRLFEGLCNRNLPRYLRQAAGYAGCREYFVWG
ncbi:exo-alpha-sialidase [Aurantiacibacter gilvus]|uniref:Exo-alpha-sialidase n=1 Tax=Aurantiacibacter gilvus TaxID=3139141 RepID=A0ABU9II05_9SPHN